MATTSITCYICGSSPSTTLPKPLVSRLITSLQIDLESIQSLLLVTCADCLIKLEKIEKLISELQDSFKKLKERDKPGGDGQSSCLDTENREECNADTEEFIAESDIWDGKDEFRHPLPPGNVCRNKRRKRNTDKLATLSRMAKTKAKSKMESIRSECRRIKVEKASRKVQDSPSKTLTCGCGVKCSSKSELTKHRKDVHEGKYVCHFAGCGRLFTKLFSLRQHEFLHNPGKHDCRVCGEKLVSPLKLQVHMRRFHHATQTLSAHIDSLLPQGSVIGQTNDNTKASKEEIEEKLHKVPHNGNNASEENGSNTPRRGKKGTDTNIQVIPDMPCPICDHSYQVESLLKRHIEKFHWQKNADTLMCCFCKAEFNDLKKLLPHVRLHRAEMQTCMECSEVFQNWSQIVKHRTSVHGGGAEHLPNTTTPYTCEVCKAVLGTKSLLSYHNLLEHGKVTKLLLPRPRLKHRCETCAMSFMTQKELEVHSQKHKRRSKDLSELSVFECNGCLKTFSDEGSREKHKTLCTGELDEEDVEKYISEFPCAVCDGTYELKQQLDRHIRQAHWRTDSNNITLRCVSCKKSYNDTKEIVKHCRSHRRDMLPCRFCPDAAFFNAFQLSVHNSQSHSCNNIQKDINRFSCTICNEETPTKSLLSFHTLTEHGEYLELTGNTVRRLYQCPHCRKSFIQLLYMKRHIITNHDQNSEPGDKYKCTKCAKGYSAEVLLQAHLVQCLSKKENPRCTHPTEEKEPQKEKIRLKKSSKRGGLCNLCGAKYNTKVMFDLHMMKHTGKWKLKCQECEAKFLTESQLRAHMKRHTKPYLCTECGARFASTGNLKDHQVTHSSAEDWKCEVCNRSFRWRYSLFRHLNTAHNIGNKYKPAHFPVQCELCGIQLMSGSMHRHIKRTHKIQYKRSYFTPVNDTILTKTQLCQPEQVQRKAQVQGTGLVQKTVQVQKAAQVQIQMEVPAHGDIHGMGEVQGQSKIRVQEKVQTAFEVQPQRNLQVEAPTAIQVQGAGAGEILDSGFGLPGPSRIEEQMAAERNMQMILDSQSMQSVMTLQPPTDWTLDMYH